MNKVISIIGPTAVGKTEVAYNIAKNFPSSLISADSIQVYKNLNIVSGKDLPQDAILIEKNPKYLSYYSFFDTAIYLLDVMLPTESFSVSQFIKYSKEICAEVFSQQKTPIFVGGTGFYIKSLLFPADTTHIPQDTLLRTSLEDKNIKELQELLFAIDKEKFLAMNRSDQNNPQRLIRAIEIASYKGTKILPEKNNLDMLIIGLKCSREELKRRIDLRVDNRMNQGALKEVETLFKEYDSLSSQVKTANGYRQLFEYFKKDVSLDEAINKWKISEYRHAKNQMTWFNKQSDILWFDIRDLDFEAKIRSTVKNWYNREYESEKI